MEDKFIQIRKDKCAYRIIEGEAFIITFSDSILHTLNKTATYIWQLIDKGIKVGELIQKISQEFEVDKETAKSDIIEFIDKLNKKRLIEIK